MLHANHRNPQLRTLPATLPSQWWEQNILLSHIANDDRYAPLNRIGTLAHVIGRITPSDGGLGQLPPKVLASFVEHTGRLSLELHPDDRSKILPLPLGDGRQLGPTIAHLLAPNLNVLAARDLAASFSGCARLGLHDDHLKESFKAAILAKSDLFDLPNLARVVWSHARMGTHTAEGLEALARAITRQEDGFSPERISMIAWSFATVNFKDEALLKKLAQEALKTVDDFQGQSFANLMWSFGKLNQHDHQLFHRLVESLEQRIDCLAPQGLANVVWSLARVEFRHERFLTQLALRCREKIDSDTGERAPSFRAEELSSLAWSFGALRFRDDALLDAIAKQTIATIRNFDNQGLANIAWAMTSLSRRDDALANAICSEVSRRGQTFSLRERSALAWAFSLYHPEQVAAIYPSAYLSREQEPHHWIQGYIALLVAGEINPHECAPFAAKLSKVNNHPPTNDFERAVGDILQTIFPSPEFTVTPHQIVATIATDFVITGRNKRLIIECDGEFYHRLAGPNGGAPKGADLIQDKLFKRLGYEVFHLPQRDFLSTTTATLAARLHRFFE